MSTRGEPMVPGFWSPVPAAWRAGWDDANDPSMHFGVPRARTPEGQRRNERLYARGFRAAALGGTAEQRYAEERSAHGGGS